MNTHTLVVLVRRFRSVHRYVGLALAVFFLIIALTGILLGWKKDVALLQPKTFTGETDQLSQWKSFQDIATASLASMDTILKDPVIDRMDVRPDKGIVKVLFTQGYWEAQIDGKTGAVLSVAQRHSDWIEHVHDGSIFSDLFKLAYTNMLGIGLFTLALSGLWLWYGPRAIRKTKL